MVDLGHSGQTKREKMEVVGHSIKSYVVRLLRIIWHSSTIKRRNLGLYQIVEYVSFSGLGILECRDELESTDKVQVVDG